MAEGRSPYMRTFPATRAPRSTEFGNFEEALKECDIVRTDRFTNKSRTAGSWNPGLSCPYDLNGNLTLWSSTQSVHYVQRSIAMVLSLPVAKGPSRKALRGGRVRSQGGGERHGDRGVPHVGTDRQAGEDALFTNRSFYTPGTAPVLPRIHDGSEEGRDHHGPPTTCYLDGGAYSEFRHRRDILRGVPPGRALQTSNMKYDGYRIYEQAHLRRQRGHGGVAARAGWEQQLDTIAAETNMDPVDSG